MRKRDFFYELPPDRIAQTPLSDRCSSRLMILSRNAETVRHAAFRDIVDEIRPDDCLVINDTKVIPARLIGQRATGGRAEILLLTRKSADVWEALVKPGKRIRLGDVLQFGGILTAHVEAVADEGKRLIRFSYKGVWEEILDKLGQTPLPPYIKQTLADKNRYQTVYAARDGSAAAPTAGLHFTHELLEKIARKGAATATVTLHVGLGTFRPVQKENIEDHEMHAEFYRLAPDQAAIMNACKSRGGRLICVGTTSCRVVESCASDEGAIKAADGETNIFIYPGYRFKAMNALITNFHLPESTLLMLVSAFYGRERILAAYEEAVRAQYRFFSFGDAMLIQ